MAIANPGFCGARTGLVTQASVLLTGQWTEKVDRIQNPEGIQNVTPDLLWPETGQLTQ